MILRYYSASCDGCSQVAEIRKTPTDAWKVAQREGWTCEVQHAEAGARPRGTYHYCPPCSRARAAASAAIEKSLGVSVDG